jgi:hypothetical protein
MNPADLLYGSDRLMEAHHLHGMAAVHEKRQELADAQRLYEEALAIYEEIFGTQHLTTGLATRNLARVLKALGKTAEAALMDDHANEILARRGEGNEDDEAATFGGSSGFFSLMGFDEKPAAPQEGNEAAAFLQSSEPLEAEAADS